MLMRHLFDRCWSKFQGVSGSTKPFAETGLAWKDMERILTERELPVISAPTVRPLSKRDAIMEAVRRDDPKRLAWLIGQTGTAPPTAVLWHAVRAGRLKLVQVCLAAGCDTLVVHPTLQDSCDQLDKAALEEELDVRRNSDALRLLVATMRAAFPVNPLLDGDGGGGGELDDASGGGDFDDGFAVARAGSLRSLASNGSMGGGSVSSVASARDRRTAALERNRARRRRRGDGGWEAKAPWDVRPETGPGALPALGSLGFRGVPLPEPAVMSQRDMIQELMDLHGLGRGHVPPGFAGAASAAAAAAAAVLPERLGSPLMQAKRKSAKKGPRGSGSREGSRSPQRSRSPAASLRAGSPGSPGKRNSMRKSAKLDAGEDEEDAAEKPRYYPRAQDEAEWKAATAGGPVEGAPATTVDERLRLSAAGETAPAEVRARYSLEGRDLLAACWEWRANGGGHTLLHLATLMGHISVALELLTGLNGGEAVGGIRGTGAVMLRGRDRLGRTPLHLACISSEHFRKARLVRVFIDAGADIEAKDNGGRTPLHWACRSEDEIAIIMLLAAGAEVCVPSNRGLIPLQCAPPEKPPKWGEADGPDDPDAAEKADQPLPVGRRKGSNQKVYGYLEKHVSREEMAAIDAKLMSKQFVDKMLLTFQKYDPVTKREMTKVHHIRTTNFPLYLYIAGRRPRGRFFLETEEEKKAKKDAKKKKKGGGSTRAGATR